MQLIITSIIIFNTAIPIASFSYAFPCMTARLRATSVAKKHGHVTSSSQSATTSVFESVRRRMQRTLLLLFLSYICILPCNLLAFCIALRLTSLDYTSTVFLVLAALYYGNVIANPIILGFQYQHFRTAMRYAISRLTKSTTVASSALFERPPSSAMASGKRVGVEKRSTSTNANHTDQSDAAASAANSVRLVSMAAEPVQSLLAAFDDTRDSQQ